MYARAVFCPASSNKESVKECVMLSQSCSSAQVLRPVSLSPCRKANDRHVSRQRDLFCCTWSLFAVVLAAASTLSPRGANTSAALQPREQQSDRQCRPNPGQVWGCVWYASLRYGINTRPVSRSACLDDRRGVEGFPTLRYMP